MAGINKGNTKNAGQLHRHVTGVGVVAVDNIRQGHFALDEFDGLVDEFVQMRPKQLLAHVLAAAALYSDDAKAVGYGFDSPCIILGENLFGQKAGKKIHPSDPIQFSQRPPEFDHVFHLTAGIGIASQFQVAAAHQAVETEHLNIKPIFRHRITLQ